jgi:hypothetical protein
VHVGQQLVEAEMLMGISAELARFIEGNADKPGHFGDGTRATPCIENGSLAYMALTSSHLLNKFQLNISDLRRQLATLEGSKTGSRT